MAAIQVKNVPEHLHDSLRRRAAREGMSIGDYVLAVLRRDLALPTQREWLEQLARRRPVEEVDVVGALRDSRRERDDELDAAHRR